LAKAFDLHRESRVFAYQLSELLNRTVCNGVRINSAVSTQKDVVVIGYNVARDNLDAMAGIPLCLHKQPRCYLGLSIRMTPTQAREHLMVLTSVMVLSRDAALEEPLLHYDYEREKPDGYPEAHLQICATSPDWEALGPERALEKLHLPVGGRRFRPTMEDLLEFLIVEELAEGRNGWQQAIEEGRDRFHEIQLRAAIRRRPGVAHEVLRELEQVQARSR
jgi:hypothetical protein